MTALLQQDGTSYRVSDEEVSSREAPKMPEILSCSLFDPLSGSAVLGATILFTLRLKARRHGLWDKLAEQKAEVCI